MALGNLRVNVTSEIGNKPLEGAVIRVVSPDEPNRVIEQTTTDSSGKTQDIELSAPPLEYSIEPGANKPYSEYTIYIDAEGYIPVEISGAEILSGETAIQNKKLLPIEPNNEEGTELFVIPDHTLWGDYPPKIEEPEIQPVNESGEIVLSRVVIPEYVVVHDGPPNDSSAENYYVPYKDYIKNVASSEIYATWTYETIVANILAIQSFTLNRVYTEFYRNRGYDFTITSSTAYDHKWIPGRNIFQSISEVVDSIFSNFLSRPGVTQPILTQYCDGRRVTCPGLMSQWGSQSLGEQGYSAIEIINYYYGDSMYINSTEVISGIPSSWPGFNLDIGSAGEKVRQMQTQLNVISDGYPLIPKITADGIYGPATAEAVRVFQDVFDLPETGVVDFPTWYKISEIYVGVSRIAEYV
ncbi:MAG: peptidoglycan-binding protein [Lachnospiraceae bacterium]|nr:peptidoglycan-binding protein [Lachnospiraceae bacterium]